MCQKTNKQKNKTKQKTGIKLPAILLWGKEKNNEKEKLFFRLIESLYLNIYWQDI